LKTNILSLSQEFLLVSGPQAMDRNMPHIEFGRPDRAADFLQRLGTTPSNLTAMRATLAEGSPHENVDSLSERDVFSQLASLIVNGSVKVVVPPMPDKIVGAPMKPFTVTPAQAEAQQVKPVPKEEAKKEETKYDVDPLVAADQAATLEKAAEKGSPVCEKCEKAKREQKKQQEAKKAQEKQQPAKVESKEELHPSPAKGYAVQPDVAANQATTLEKASDNGAPFCEKCEKARQEQARKKSQQE
jgi:hypothetical protein